MTIDERLEALTMHLEITAGMARDNEIKIEKMARENEVRARENEVRARDSEIRMDKILALVEIDAENIRALARIAEAHEHRINGLEGTR